MDSISLKQRITPTPTLILIVIVFVPLTDATMISSCTNGKISLSCATSSGCALSIRNASFAHPTTIPIPGNCTTQTDDCRTNASMVWSACDGKRQCSFTVPQERPKGSCTTVSSYMEVEYKCVCVSCKVLTALPRRTVTYSSPYLIQGTVATYACLEGYELAGPKTRMCLASGEWSNSEPVCSVPLRVCPPSSRPRRTYRSRCYEFVASVTTWESARNNCSKNNGTIVAPRSKSELYFLTMEVGKLDIYGYIWLSKDEDLSVGMASSSASNKTTVAAPTGKACLEMYRPERSKGTWLQRETSCNYLNSYICAYEISREAVENIISENRSKRTRTGIVIGITIGIVILALGLFCIFCRDRKRNNPKGITIEDGRNPREKPMPSRDFENEIYDDTLPECDVTSTSTSAGDVPQYAEVFKGKRRTGNVHYNYDEVYTTMRAAPDGKLSRANTYENITVQNIMGSLKKTLTRPWRLSGSHKISDNNGSTHSNSELESGAVVVRNKPKPAPKPAIRRSALEAKLEAIKQQKGMNVSSEEESSPSLSSRNEKSILRDHSGPGGRAQTPDEKVRSGIEIVENEIYDEDNKATELTEL